MKVGRNSTTEKSGQNFEGSHPMPPEPAHPLANEGGGIVPIHEQHAPLGHAFPAKEPPLGQRQPERMGDNRLAGRPRRGNEGDAAGHEQIAHIRRQVLIRLGEKVGDRDGLGPATAAARPLRGEQLLEAGNGRLQAGLPVRDRAIHREAALMKVLLLALVEEIKARHM